jgi:hypothetical protein
MAHVVGGFVSRSRNFADLETVDAGEEAEVPQDHLGAR